ncbi:ribosome biogenesis GTPase YlqF [Clostridium formicaceticum]|uniref:Ribosome biogenesis GTPase A n=1 Tax=Clostridium formicaceticum TaxID=1497 RepID=A0AAC9RMU0_9CLOT|nr:ribosome biogenesis GTPase YlqF [Clostridium formicaceticum]AOY77334.1 ribosome biogenesis GTPase YlqF [Clostridium formicaceticum]ARE87878.1 Ribosome biogenesis GTPase A [Clostridium formicaceticum]
MNINWYPGHMKKTRELLKEQLKLVDVVFELLDARIPLSSKNPMIDEIIGNKPKVVVLNKSDLANDNITRQWIDFYKAQGLKAIPMNTIEGKGLREVTIEAENAVKEKMEALKQKGRRSRAIRIMIVGIPNVGKSSIINRLAGKKSAKTGDRPGVTKGKQWIRLRGNMELLDTPGILWPKFEDEEVALNLAFTGAIKDEIMDTETLALKLIESLWRKEKEKVVERYKVEEELELPIEVMDRIAKNRGCIIGGGGINYTRTANMVLDEFRAGKIGKISLETPV